MHIANIILSIAFTVTPIPFNPHPVNLQVQKGTVHCLLEETPIINPIENLDNMLIEKRILDKSV